MGLQGPPFLKSFRDLFRWLIPQSFGDVLYAIVALKSLQVLMKM